LLQPESVLTSKKLPRQTSLEEGAHAKMVGDVVSNTVIAVLTASFMISMLVAGPLNQILGALKQL
jgi:hypothetical protein